MNKQQGHIGLIVIVIITLVLLGTLGYLFYKNTSKDQPADGGSNSGKSTQKTVQTKEFHSQQHDITFHHPIDWKVEETLETGNAAEWYASTVKVFDQDNKLLAVLNTGGQYGGLCSEDAPFVETLTTVKDPLDLAGIGKTNFGYTIVKTSEGNYRVAFGLAKDELTLGDKSVQCPGMGVNYNYIAISNVQALGGITFGHWYDEGDDGFKYSSFKTLDAAKSYAQTDEFKEVKAMVESLAIGE